MFTSLALGFCFCGEIGRNLRLGDLSGTPRALFDKERRRVVPGRGSDLPSCSGTGLLASRFVFEVIKVTRPNRGRLSCAHATAAEVRFSGWEKRRCRRSHDGVALGFSDTAEKRPLVVVSVW